MFELFRKKIYKGDIVYLKEKYHVSEQTAYDGIATIYYDVYNYNNEKVGSVDLRTTSNDYLYYYGNIGYNIIESKRGHNYSYYACLLLMKIAKEEYGMEELLITCSPENIASHKIIKKLNGEFIELTDVPKYHPLYSNGETKKYIYRFKV